jgi:hypothetical protein
MSTSETIDNKIKDILSKSAKVYNFSDPETHFSKPTLFNFDKTKYFLVGSALPTGVDTPFYAKIRDDTDKVFFEVYKKETIRKPFNQNQGFDPSGIEFFKYKTDNKFWSNISIPTRTGGKKSKKTKRSTKKQRKTRKHKK